MKLVGLTAWHFHSLPSALVSSSSKNVMVSAVGNLKKWILVVTFVVGITTPSIASAHIGHSAGSNGLAAGLLHPLLGWDHLLAMFAVGLLGAQLGGKLMWIVPGTFVLGMIGGGIAGIIGMPVPAVELGIALSVLLLGICVAAELKFNPFVPVIFAAIFGIVHGHAHGGEIPNVENALGYTIGFTIATTMLHLLGLLTGRSARKNVQGIGRLRLSGAAIAMAGCWLLLGR